MAVGVDDARDVCGALVEGGLTLEKVVASVPECDLVWAYCAGTVCRGCVEAELGSVGEGEGVW